MKTIKFTKNFVFPIIVLLQLGLNSANAQIIHYKDFNHDIAIDDSQIEDSVKIDFNEDGVNDMKFTIFNDPYEPVPGVIIESIGCLAKPLGNSDFESLIYYNYLPSWTWGDKLDLNEIISSSQTYAEWEVILYGTIPSSYQESGTWWELPANGYFGFRFKISGEYHYGWIHLSITGSHDGVAQLNILEYAYNTHANEQILAGQTGIYLPLEAVSSVSVLDVANNGDGRDMEVTFSKVSDETLVSEYRVMVVKTPDSYSFDLASANSTENYLSVLPNGSGHVTLLPQNFKDVENDLITNNVSYKVFVLAVADGVWANTNALSMPSNMLTLVDTQQGIYDPVLDAKIKIYPNPASEMIQLTSPEKIKHIQLFDINGKLILSNDLNCESYEIPVSGLSKGSYNVVISTADKQTTKRIVIE